MRRGAPLAGFAAAAETTNVAGRAPGEAPGPSGPASTRCGSQAAHPAHSNAARTPAGTQPPGAMTAMAIR